MKTLTYNPDLKGKTIITDAQTQRNLVFGEGHPLFLIPDFNENPEDIWLAYEDYIEKTLGAIYEQDGGEITSYKPIHPSGLMLVEYTLYGISLESDKDNPKDYSITVEGFVVTDPQWSTIPIGYFLATKVSGDL